MKEPPGPWKAFAGRRRSRILVRSRLPPLFEDRGTTHLRLAISAVSERCGGRGSDFNPPCPAVDASDGIYELVDSGWVLLAGFVVLVGPLVDSALV